MIAPDPRFDPSARVTAKRPRATITCRLCGRLVDDTPAEIEHHAKVHRMRDRIRALREERKSAEQEG
jgi:hypothetical protein